MLDVIYVPLGDTEALKYWRQELIAEFVRQGWKMDSKVELRDFLSTNVIPVQVLTRGS